MLRWFLNSSVVAVTFSVLAVTICVLAAYPRALRVQGTADIHHGDACDHGGARDRVSVLNYVIVDRLG